MNGLTDFFATINIFLLLAYMWVTASLELKVKMLT